MTNEFCCDNRLTRLKTKPRHCAARATWRSGYAADCKSVYTGSIPVVASKVPLSGVLTVPEFRLDFARVAIYGALRSHRAFGL